MKKLFAMLAVMAFLAGCNTIQGFYFSRPVEAASIPALLIDGNMMMEGAKPNA